MEYFFFSFARVRALNKVINAAVFFFFFNENKPLYMLTSKIHQSRSCCNKRKVTWPVYVGYMFVYRLYFMWYCCLCGVCVLLPTWLCNSHKTQDDVSRSKHFHNRNYLSSRGIISGTLLGFFPMQELGNLVAFLSF